MASCKHNAGYSVSMHQALDSHDRKLSVICIPSWLCESRLPVRLVQIFTTVLVMLIGTAVYYLDRFWGSSVLLQLFIDYLWPASGAFGPFVGSLPPMQCHGAFNPIKQ